MKIFYYLSSLKHLVNIIFCLFLHIQKSSIIAIGNKDISPTYTSWDYIKIIHSYSILQGHSIIRNVNPTFQLVKHILLSRPDSENFSFGLLIDLLNAIRN